MVTDFKVAAYAACALLAGVATVETVGQMGSGPSCMREQAGQARTKICSGKEFIKAQQATTAPVHAVEPELVSYPASSSFPQMASVLGM